MCCSSRLWRAEETGSGRGLARAVAVVLGGILAAAATPSAQAQALVPNPAPARRPLPPPVPSPTPTAVDADISAGAAVINLGSNFLERLGDQASSGFGRALRSNPGGGGGSEATDAARIRTWGEVYGISAKTGAQADFVGDRRQTWGGVAGLGAMVLPGVNVGFSVDQAGPRSTFPWRCSPRPSISPSSASTPRSTRGHGPGPSRWSMDSGKSIQTGTRFRLRQRRLRRADRRRAGGTRLLLEHGAEPHRAESRARICARHERLVPGGRGA
jgi:hypothetical protein